MIGNIARILAAIVLTILLTVFALARITLEVIGASTAPEDFAQLQQRMPTMASWLFSTPAWVPTILILGLAAAAAWLFWSGASRTASDAIKAGDEDHVEEVRALNSKLQELAKELDERTKPTALEGVVEKHVARTNVAPPANSKLEGELGSLNDRVSEIAKGCSDLEQKFDGWVRSHNDSIDIRFEGIDQAFNALYYRDWHHRLYNDLLDRFEDLSAPVKAGAGLDDADLWLQEVKSWRSLLDQYLVIANYYSAGSADRILRVRDHLYDGKWSFNENALSANHVHRYKEMAIWHLNLKNEQPRIEKSFEQVIFRAPSRRARLDPMPAVPFLSD